MCVCVQVEVKAVWLGRKDGKEGPTHRDKMVDSVMGVRKPTFKRSYCPTRLNASCLYHSITMMMVSSQQWHWPELILLLLTSTMRG